MNVFGAFSKMFRLGRKRHMPERDTRAYPILSQFGNQVRGQRYLYKPTARNLRFFSHTPYARRAINAIKNPLSMLEWEITPADGVKDNAELKRQIEAATFCFTHPNLDDSFATLLEQTIEDYCVGAAAIEMQLSGDESRPLWMYPVDGLSIQIFPMWSGGKNEARYAQVVGYGTTFGGTIAAELTNEEMMYIRPNASSATPFGFGPLEIAFNTVTNILGVAEFTGRVSTNQHSSVALELGEGVDQQYLNEFRKYWIDDIEGQGKVPIVATQSSGRSDEKSKRGFQVHRLYPEGDSAMYLEYQNFLLRTLAASFDLSPQNLGLESDVNRNTSETAEDRDWNQAIKPLGSKIAQHMTRDALHGKLGFSQLKFRFKGIEKEDQETNAKIYKTLYEGNATTPNEHRERTGQKPLTNDWADKTFADLQIALKASLKTIDDSKPTKD